MKKDIILEKLLCYGFFPERLDGIFTSELFGKWIIANNAKINTPRNNRYSLLSYKLTRNNNSPRHMGIPHPLGFFRVCKEIFDNWEKIKAKINNTSSEEMVPFQNSSNKDSSIEDNRSFNFCFTSSGFVNPDTSNSAR